MKAFALLLLPFWLMAVPLDLLIESAKEKHPSLEVLKQKVFMIESDLALSQNFADPVLTLGINDINFDDPTDRSIEPMQTTALSYQQKIPYFGKRSAKSKVLESKKEQANLSIEELQVKLVYEIKTTAYTIWHKEEELKIINEYIKLTKQNIELYSAISASDARAHMSIMSAEMSLSELKIKKTKLLSSLEAMYQRVSYLSEMQVEQIELDMQMQEPRKLAYYLDTQTKNLSYRKKVSVIDEAHKEIELKELEIYSDPVVKVGYFHRDGFDDYASVTLAYSLPIFGSQEIATQKARQNLLSKESEKQDFNKRLSAQIHESYAQMQEAFKIHNIITSESMPQIEHMFDLSSSSIKSGDELFLYVELLEKKLALDAQNIKVIAAYHKSLASLDAYIGIAQ
jgi:outer membrane protein, heavy metal efflux system